MSGSLSSLGDPTIYVFSQQIFQQNFHLGMRDDSDKHLRYEAFIIESIA